MDLKEKQFASVEQEIVLHALAESVAHSGCKFLEVGSWLGHSTVILAKVVRSHGGILFCVDWWKGNMGTELVDIASRSDVFSSFWAQICKEGLDDVVVPIRSRSDLAAEILKEKCFDLVFLDADHRYKAILNDIKRYVSLVNPDRGILCGHDCEGRISDYEEFFLKDGETVDYYETVHCGVVKAVGETFSDYSINHGIWSVQYSSQENAWKLPDVKFTNISNERQVMPPPLGDGKTYYVVRYGRSVYAVPKDIHHSVIKNERDLKGFAIAKSNSWQELEKIINEPITLRYQVAGQLPPISKSLASEKGVEGLNIAKLRDNYWTLLQSLGLVDLGKPGTDNLLKKLTKQCEHFLVDSVERDSEIKNLKDFIPEVIFSIIIPTRNATASLKRLFDSFLENTTDLKSIEVVLVVDEDDDASLKFEFHGFWVKKVIVKPGLTMGALNMAGYKHTTGRYIMLLNDDVIIRTPGWDQKVLAAFHTFYDQIVLVHVNDKIFEDKLCTFPFVSRKFCEITDGICPEEYVRYRIDDHIYNIFNLLAVMGQRRILYLPDIVFEHLNRSNEKVGGIAYHPNERIHRLDTETFERMLEFRKTTSLDLMNHIDVSRHQQNREMRRGHLADITDSSSLRRPEFFRTVQGDTHPCSKDVRITIGLVSANIKSPHAQKCLDAIKEHTENFDLIILDNNHEKDFNHPAEMNRMLSACRTEYLVLMDDDVFVEKKWLDGMLRCLTPFVGVVTPMHKDKNGDFSYAGIVMKPDLSGHHSHIYKRIEKATSVQTICSAVMLIDMGKCGHVRIDEAYSKYFLDIDYGFRIWESGYKVVCSPFSVVTHVGGATLAHGSQKSNEIFEAQRGCFVKKWIETERYWKLLHAFWQNDSDIKALLDVPKQIKTLSTRRSGESLENFLIRTLDYVSRFQSIPIMMEYIRQELNREMAGLSDNKHLQYLNEMLKRPIPFPLEMAEISRSIQAIKTISRPVTSTVTASEENVCVSTPRLIESGYRSFNIIECGRCYAILQADGAFDADKIRKREFCVTVIGNSAAQVKKGVDNAIKKYFWLRWPRAVRIVRKLFKWNCFIQCDACKVFSGKKENCGESSNGKVRADSTVVVPSMENYRGFLIFKYESKFFAIPAQSIEIAGGGISSDRFRHGGYFEAVGHSLPEVHWAIDRIVESRGKAPCLVRRLVFACISDKVLKPLLQHSYNTADLTILVGSKQSHAWPGYNIIECGETSLGAWVEKQSNHQKIYSKDPIKPHMFDAIVVPWLYPDSWGDNTLEAVAQKFSNQVEILHANGVKRPYSGENLHRLVYNKAYLASMFQAVPRLSGQKVLEVGCSDGMVCDIMALSGASRVTGVDVMKTAGCGFPGENIEYHTMDAAQLSFEDKSFDMVYSIATLEHVPDPYKVLLEILRVTRVGGYAYVQAGPLFHAPFGHHMFAYFQDYPWIHLRKSQDEIIDYARKQGIDKKIESDLGMSCEAYISGMLSKDHVNGLFLKDYRLDEFTKRKDIKILKHHISYEGRDILTSKIASEIKDVDSRQLVEHGFELAFRRIK